MNLKATFSCFIVFFILLCSTGASAKKWDSVSTGAGFDKQVLCLYADSATQTLYAGGAFTTVDGITVNGIAKWNGTTWAAMGAGFTSPNAVVYAITMYGGQVYAGGYFTTSGSTTVNNIAKWDGTAWQPLSSGMSTTGTYDFVSSFATFGGDLYVGGEFSKAGTITAKNIAKWNGTVWSTLGLFGGIDDRVNTLYVHGGELYAGGDFVINATTFSFQYRICKLGASGWDNVGTKGVGDATALWSVKAFATYNNKLFTGGYFNVLETGSPANHMASWNGTAWASVGTPAGVTSSLTDPVRALQVYKNKLYAGGTFSAAGAATAGYLAVWNDTAWAAVDSAMLNGKVSATAVYKGALIIAGDFTTAGGASRGRIAKFDLTPAAPPPSLINETSSMLRCIAVPNPAGESVSLQVISTTVPETLTAVISDVSGKVVDKLQVRGENKILVNRNGLPAGTYYYSVYSGSSAIGTGNIVFR